MEKFASYKILTNKKLVIEYYRGKTTVDDLIAFKKKLLQDTNYNVSWDTIADFRACSLLVKSKDVIKLVEFMKQEYKDGYGRWVNLLASKPNEFAVWTLYLTLTSESGLKFNFNMVSETEDLIKDFKKDHLTSLELNRVLNDIKAEPNIYL
ncbi:MAG: hypothetical protein KBT58_01770 [Bizionia sp.]|nr:hypothetical protein [Bizionia sp.]